MELIGPETNLYDRRERGGMRSLADVGEIVVERQPMQETVVENKENIMTCNQALELDYGGNLDGLLFTFNPER